MQHLRETRGWGIQTKIHTTWPLWRKIPIRPSIEDANPVDCQLPLALHSGDGNFAAALRWMGKQDHMTRTIAGNTAPRFSLKSLDKREYSLDVLIEGGPVVAAFFKISCPVCQFTFPFLERLHKRYGGDNVTFLGIS